jgi:hypothetical protein
MHDGTLPRVDATCGTVWATIRVTPARAAFSGPGISKTPAVVVKRTQVTF